MLKAKKGGRIVLLFDELDGWTNIAAFFSQEGLRIEKE